MLRYLVGFFVTIGLVVLLIILLFSGGNDSSQKKLMTSGKPLASYASTDAQARLIIDGPIVAPIDHRQIVITVDRNSAKIDLEQGYDGSVIESHVYPNTEASYREFLHSLALLNFTKGITNDASLKSESGHCASGNRFVFELAQTGKLIQHLWATSCNGPRSFEGNVDSTVYLFKRQIPGYDNLRLPLQY